MRVEFYREGAQEPAGIARWDGREAVLEEAEDEATGHAIVSIFRPSAVATDDASLRPASTKGESVIQPGSLDWFRAAALTRGPQSGLTPRFVPGLATGEGFDPAAQYRKFRDQMSRFASED